MAEDQQDRFEVVIVGGGPVGLTLALGLVRSLAGIRVALVDRRDFAIPRDQRASALSAGVRRVFEALGIWEAMAPAATAIRQMRLTDSGEGDIFRPLFLSFGGEVAPGEPFAHMVPNTALLAALMAELDGRVSLLAPAEITGLEREGALARLALADGRVLAAPLVVAADGGRSVLRQMAGIGTIAHDYRQVGLVTTITHALDHEGTAFQHFRPGGPFASLPLSAPDGSGTMSSLVWTETAAEAGRLRALGDGELRLAIEAAMGSELGAVGAADPLQGFPLSLRLARSFIAERLALAGDAAHVIHPIAGQGLNLGLADAAALTEVVVDALRLGMDPGAPGVLERYQRWRRFDTASMAAMTDMLNRLFANDSAALRALRDMGLGVVERVDPLKQALIRRAAGLERNGPRLLRGLPV